MDKKKRPTSVTVIAWIIIVSGGLGLVGMLPFSYISHTIPEVRQALEVSGIGGMSVTTAILWIVMSCAINAVSGIAMLKGLNWGRLLYLCFIPISIIFGWVLYGFDEVYIPTIIFYIVILLFLTRPAASAFFRSGVLAASKPEE